MLTQLYGSEFAPEANQICHILKCCQTDNITHKYFIFLKKTWKDDDHSNIMPRNMVTMPLSWHDHEYVFHHDHGMIKEWCMVIILFQPGWFLFVLNNEKATKTWHYVKMPLNWGDSLILCFGKINILNSDGSLFSSRIFIHEKTGIWTQKWVRFKVNVWLVLFLQLIGSIPSKSGFASREVLVSSVATQTQCQVERGLSSIVREDRWKEMKYSSITLLTTCSSVKWKYLEHVSIYMNSKMPTFRDSFFFTAERSGNVFVCFFSFPIIFCYVSTCRILFTTIFICEDYQDFYLVATETWFKEINFGFLKTSKMKCI